MPPKANTAEDLRLAREMGERIKQRRIELGIKGPRDLARAMNAENIYSMGDNLAAIEAGRHQPRIGLLLQIAAALHVPASYILGDLAGRDESFEAGRRAGLTDAIVHLTDIRRQGESGS